MENQQQQAQTCTSQCRGGCGFYGSPATEGLCSKCFKDSIKRKQDTSGGPAQRTSPSSEACSTSVGQEDFSSQIPAASDAAAQSMLDVSMEGGGVAATAESPVMGLLPNPLVAGITACDSSASLSSSCSANSLEEQMGSSPNTSSPLGGAKKANRCNTCKKRVGLTGFMCRCGGLYCGEHRYDKAHDCTFDYKTTEREAIRKNNPVVVSDKIQRI